MGVTRTAHGVGGVTFQMETNMWDDRQLILRLIGSHPL